MVIFRQRTEKKKIKKKKKNENENRNQSALLYLFFFFYLSLVTHSLVTLLHSFFPSWPCPCLVSFLLLSFLPSFLPLVSNAKGRLKAVRFCALCGWMQPKYSTYSTQPRTKGTERANQAQIEFSVFCICGWDWEGGQTLFLTWPRANNCMFATLPLLFSVQATVTKEREGTRACV